MSEENEKENPIAKPACNFSEEKLQVFHTVSAVNEYSGHEIDVNDWYSWVMLLGCFAPLYTAIIFLVYAQTVIRILNMIGAILLIVIPAIFLVGSFKTKFSKKPRLFFGNFFVFMTLDFAASFLMVINFYFMYFDDVIFRIMFLIYSIVAGIMVVFLSVTILIRRIRIQKFLPFYREELQKRTLKLITVSKRQRKKIVELKKKIAENGLELDGHYLAISYQDRVVVGIVDSEELSDTESKVVYGILPEYRNQGYGTEILHLAMLKIADVHERTIVLTCSENNEAAKRTIEKNSGELNEKKSTEAVLYYHIVLPAI